MSLTSSVVGRKQHVGSAAGDGLQEEFALARIVHLSSELAQRGRSSTRDGAQKAIQECVILGSDCRGHSQKGEEHLCHRARWRGRGVKGSWTWTWGRKTTGVGVRARKLL